MSVTLKAAFRVSLGKDRGTVVVANPDGAKNRVWWVKDSTGESVVVDADAVNYGSEDFQRIAVISDGGATVWDFDVLSRIPVPEGTTSMVFNQVTVSISIGAK